MAAEFYNYKNHKLYWFVVYLEYAAAICEAPELSVKNFDLKAYLDSKDGQEFKKRMERIMWAK